MTRKELYSICHDEAVAYANLEQWSKRTGEEKSFLIQGYLDAMMEMRKSEITEMKKEYPKTYEECCKILGLDNLINMHLSFMDGDDKIIASTNYHVKTLIELNCLTKLRICRDAYWKIAGEEMGLGKPWEPDWREERYIIYRNQDYIIGGYREAGCVEHHILVFPTAEMRDAFKENFKEEIENCKELL